MAKKQRTKLQFINQLEKKCHNWNFNSNWWNWTCSLGRTICKFNGSRNSNSNWSVLVHCIRQEKLEKLFLKCSNCIWINHWFHRVNSVLKRKHFVIQSRHKFHFKNYCLCCFGIEFYFLGCRIIVF